MDYIAQSKDYWVAPNAIYITLNAMGDANRVQASVASGAAIMCYLKNNAGDVLLDYDSAHQFQTWPLYLSPTYFNTDTYNARISHYEPSLLYAYGSTLYYYMGVRTSLLASIPLFKQSLYINTKLGITKYFNRSTISSGLERINANHREDLQVQIRWKF